MACLHLQLLRLPDVCVHALLFCPSHLFPQKPASPVHHQFSTGHANSPCTIIIGKAQIEKVTVPARPYRMLNNLAFSQKIDYKEDLSGKAARVPVIVTLDVLTGFVTVPRLVHLPSCVPS